MKNKDINIEKNIHKYLKKKFSYQKKDIIYGIGDDCSVIHSSKKDILYTTDTLVEGNHFIFNWCSPENIAEKLFEKNLSDIIAKNGNPDYALLAMQINNEKSQSSSFIKIFFQHLKKIMEKNNVSLIGGDISHSNTNAFTLFLTGSTKHFIPRYSNSVVKKDPIVLIGKTGMSSFILEKLKKNIKILPENLQFYTNPKACHSALEIFQKIKPNISIDQSDSLFEACLELAEANQHSIVLQLDKIPIHNIFIHRKKESFENFTKLHMKHVLFGGEDFAIVSSFSQKHQKKLQKIINKNPQFDINIIGYFLEKSKFPKVQLFWKEKKIPHQNLSQKLYKHFASINNNTV